MFGSAHLLILFLIGVIIVGALIFAIRRSRGSFAAKAARVIAYLYIAASVIGTATLVIGTFVNRSVHVSLPVTQFWPVLLPGAKWDGLQAKVVGGGFGVASVDVEGLDVPTRFWLAGEQALQGTTSIVIGVVVVLLCTSVLRSSPFRPALVRGINVSAITVIVGGILWQLCGAIGGMLASGQVLKYSSGEYTATAKSLDPATIYGLPQWGGGSWTIDLWPIGIGVTLLVLSAAFRYGAQLQKDTEGLV